MKKNFVLSEKNDTKELTDAEVSAAFSLNILFLATRIIRRLNFICMKENQIKKFIMLISIWLLFNSLHIKMSWSYVLVEPLNIFIKEVNFVFFSIFLIFFFFVYSFDFETDILLAFATLNFSHVNAYWVLILYHKKLELILNQQTDQK